MENNDMDQNQEVSHVAEDKAKAFQEYLDKAEIGGIQMFEAGENGEAKVFRSNLPVRGHKLPFMILVDGTVYTLVQIALAENIVTEANKAAIMEYLNDLNTEYRMLKYNCDGAGNLLMTLVITSGVETFDPGMIINLLNEIQTHLDTVYPDIMKKLWKDGGEEKSES